MDNSISSLLTELKDLKADIENETQAAKREIERAAQLSKDKLNDMEKKASAKIDNIIVMLENLQENEVACTSDTGPVQQSAQQLPTSQPTLSPESTSQEGLSQSPPVSRLGQQQQAPSQESTPQEGLSQSPLVPRLGQQQQAPSQESTPQEGLSQSPLVPRLGQQQQEPSQESTPQEGLSQSPLVPRLGQQQQAPSQESTPQEGLSQSPPVSRLGQQPQEPSQESTPQEGLSQSPPVSRLGQQPQEPSQEGLSQSPLVPRLGQQQQAPSQSPQQAPSQSPPSQSPLPLPLSTTMPYTQTQQSQPTVTSQANGNRICGGCMTCDMMREEATFTSTTTGKRYDVIGFATCKTSNVVYLIQCALCNQQYVGMTTQPLHKRMNGHRSDIYNDRNNGGVARHFCSDGHTLDHFTVMVIEVLNDPSGVRPREKYWIVELQTKYPNGMNLRC